MKKCSKCEQLKDLSLFFKDKGFKDGHASICKACKQANTYAWREKNKDKYNSDHKAWAAKNYTRLRLMRYDLTPQEHATMMHNQGGTCAICKELPKGKRPLVVDHDHKTGAIRGLLCYGCNRALAVLDNTELFNKCMAYLKKESK